MDALENSMVNGVADGFFYNFIKKIGVELEKGDVDEEDAPTVQYEAGRGDLRDAKLSWSFGKN